MLRASTARQHSAPCNPMRMHAGALSGLGVTASVGATPLADARPRLSPATALPPGAALSPPPRAAHSSARARHGDGTPLLPASLDELGRPRPPTGVRLARPVATARSPLNHQVEVADLQACQFTIKIQSSS
jgi:hypothetical protein